MNRVNLLRCAILSGISCISFATPALAQDRAQGASDATPAFDEIIVTAQRRAQIATDVPISLTTFSADDISKQNVKGLDDYFAKSPNVSFISTGARDRKEISIRGVTNQLSTEANPRTSTFGFYIDDFNVSTGTVNPEIVDIERIEVLRGPQGTYFGRNAIGGAINITTNQADPSQYEGEASIGYSSFNTIDTHAVFNAPLVDDVIGLRMAGRYSHSDGNIKNINEIGGGNDSDYYYGKASLRIQPTYNLTVDLSGTYTKENVGMREGVPSGVLGDTALAVVFPGIDDPQADPDGVGFFPENTNKVNFNRPQKIGTEFYFVTGRAVWESEAFTLTSITGYIHSDQFLQGDIDGSSKDYYYEEKPITRQSFSQEIRVQSPDNGDPLSWTFGGMYAEDKGDLNQFTYTGADNPFGLEPDLAITSTLSNGKSESWAVFAQGAYEFTDALSLTLGGRFTHEKVTVAQFNTSNGEINGQVNESASFDNFSPRITLAYELANRTNVYATASRGFKAGGVQINPNLDDTSYEPETLWNYEVGFKTEAFDRRLLLNAAVFYMEWSDLQTAFAQAEVDGDDITFFSGIENAASATSKGFELDATYRFTPGLKLGGSVGYLDAKFEDYTNAYVNGNIVDLSDYRMPNSPKWTLSAFGEYEFAPTQDVDAYIRAEWTYRDSIYSSKEALVYDVWPYRVPSFDVVNLRAGFSWDNFSVQAYAENLLNEKYFTNAYEKAFAGGLYVQPSVRNFGGRFTVTF
ncbi:TonB-dependent receptor [Altericroceibacterium endophyticum]|uniref:TonB-dependent receptor n=1 Tax=Altericroceibacterium endophyticum TaxID=1808508 RepID=A0A6I4T8E5_9SPHN|nr:TonB-dependent receptor [Altericroceibacterium endophyticum]MXO67057.1 TonB-dependent receptor [Altericroceibacterium endophyticum]